MTPLSDETNFGRNGCSSFYFPDHCKCYLFSLVTPVHSVHIWIALFCDLNELNDDDDDDPAWPTRDSVLSRCISLSRSVMRVLYTFSCSILHTLANRLNSILASLGPQLKWDKFWIFFSNKSMATRARWAFQVSLDSLEILFRWGKKNVYMTLPKIY